MENKNSNPGLTYGLIAGLLMILLTLGLYLGGAESFLSPVSYLGYVILIVVAVMAGRKQKQVNGGFLPFSQALKIVFSVFVVAMLLQTLFTYLLFNFIDTDFAAALNQISMEKAEEIMRKFGVPEADIEKALEQSRNQNNYSLGKMLLGFFISCIFSFIFALIIAAIIKKKQPEFDNLDNSFNPQ